MGNFLIGFWGFLVGVERFLFSDDDGVGGSLTAVEAVCDGGKEERHCG